MEPGKGSITGTEKVRGSFSSLSPACAGPTKCQMLGQVPEEEERKPGGSSLLLGCQEKNPSGNNSGAKECGGSCVGGWGSAAFQGRKERGWPSVLRPGW